MLYNLTACNLAFCPQSSKFLRIAKQLGLLSVAQRQVLVENMLEKDFDTQSYYDRGVCGKPLSSFQDKERSKHYVFVLKPRKHIAWPLSAPSADQQIHLRIHVYT